MFRLFDNYNFMNHIKYDLSCKIIAVCNLRIYKSICLKQCYD